MDRDRVVNEDGKTYIVLDGGYFEPRDLKQSLRVTHRDSASFHTHIDITWQSGPIEEVGINGAGIEDVIDLLIKRLEGFNAGPMRCRENSLAITKLEEARLWLLQRTLNRIAAGVEGTNQPHGAKG